MYVVSRAAIIAGLACAVFPAAAQEQTGQMALVRATSPDVHALRYYAKFGRHRAVPTGAGTASPAVSRF